MRTVIAIWTVGLSLAATATVAQAQEDSALVALHELRREGSSVCMYDHYHHGASSGQRSRKAALNEAVASWRGFTAWEYGDHWASWRRAKSKSVSCEQTSGGWSCGVDARPCKRYVRSARRR